LWLPFTRSFFPPVSFIYLSFFDILSTDLKPGPARRVDLGPCRPGPRIGPGLNKNPPGSWPGKTRLTRWVDPEPGRPGKTRLRPGLLFFLYRHIKLHCVKRWRWVNAFQGGSIISWKSADFQERSKIPFFDPPWWTWKRTKRDALRSCDWGSQLIDMAEAELLLILTKTNVRDEILSWKQSCWCLGMNSCYYWCNWSSQLIAAACCWRKKLFTFEITMVELVCDQGVVAREEVTSG